MDYADVKSSNVQAVGYDPTTRTLGVKFRSGQEWHYGDVPPETHAALLAAESIGKHFHGTVRPAFKGKRIDG